MEDGEKERRREGEREAKPRRRAVIRRHTDLEVFQRAFAAAMRFYELSKSFPAEERYSLTDQGRRSSRSICGNIAEAWRKRRYPAAFVSKLTDAEGEAAETQVWIQFAVKCGYTKADDGRALYSEYDEIIAMIVDMIRHAEDWSF
jgi:four helix bundle protein